MTPSPSHGFQRRDQRREWICLLGSADPAWLKAQKEALCPDIEPHLEPEYMVPAETGMVMMQARQDGSGPRFNLGEVTVSRCIVKIGDIMGYAMVMGSDLGHAQVAAQFDALLQTPDHGPELQKNLLPRLQQIQDRRQAREAQEVNTSKVEFFTLKRGE